MCFGVAMILGKCLGKVLMSEINTGTRFLFQHSSRTTETPEKKKRANLWLVESYHVSRSIVFTNGTEESKIAALSKEREQTRSKNSVITTQIQQLVTFYPGEPEHQVCDF